MADTFIPTNPIAGEPEPVANDGFFPDLTVEDLKAKTGLGNVFGASRVSAALRVAMIEINGVLSDWRAGQTAETLAAVPATMYGNVSEKVTLYETAVYARARAVLLQTTRDYDSTKSGHDRADALEETAADWLAKSAESVARMIGRPRMTVELI